MTPLQQSARMAVVGSLILLIVVALWWVPAFRHLFFLAQNGGFCSPNGASCFTGTTTGVCESGTCMAAQSSIGYPSSSSVSMTDIWCCDANGQCTGGDPFETSCPNGAPTFHDYTCNYTCPGQGSASAAQSSGGHQSAGSSVSGGGASSAPSAASSAGNPSSPSGGASSANAQSSTAASVLGNGGTSSANSASGMGGSASSASSAKAGSASSAFCGDGVVERPETCDAGTANADTPGAPCRTDCTLPRCGDGIVDPTEECDGGAANGHDGKCTADCKKTFCGDLTVQSPDGQGINEQCDLGGVVPLPSGPQGRPFVSCYDTGGSWVCCDPTLPCNPADPAATPLNPNDIANVGILPFCYFSAPGAQPLCYVSQSPDSPATYLGSNNDFGTCNMLCQITSCGDGVVQKPNGNGQYEECDDGKANGHDGKCTADCKKTFCGDGVVQNPDGAGHDEQCDTGGVTQADDGNPLRWDGTGVSDPHGTCNMQCQDTFCGDGSVQNPDGTGVAEQCDDGGHNGVAGDPCSANCRLIAASTSSVGSTSSSSSAGCGYSVIWGDANPPQTVLQAFNQCTSLGGTRLVSAAGIACSAAVGCCDPLCNTGPCGGLACGASSSNSSMSAAAASESIGSADASSSQSCRTDMDCGSGEDCVGSICKARSSASASTASRSSASSSAASCGGNADCPAGEQCDDGQCANASSSASSVASAGFCCIGGNYCAQGIGCGYADCSACHAATSSAASARSESSVAECDPDSCSEGGTAFCYATNQSCENLTSLPCVRCIAGGGTNGGANGGTNGGTTGGTTGVTGGVTGGTNGGTNGGTMGGTDGGLSSSAGNSCTGTECAQGGNTYCQSLNETCTTIPDAPCIRCIGPAASSAPFLVSSSSTSAANYCCVNGNVIQSPSCSLTRDEASFDCANASSAGVFGYGSSSAEVCTGTECAQGGSVFCGSQNLACAPLSGAPCIQCVPPCSTDAQCSRGQKCVGGGCITAVCGNGTVEPGEECDDGSTRNGHDGICDSSCHRLAGSCGDGIVETLLGEQCEPSLPSPVAGVTCNGHCRFNLLFCGNGKIDPGESCDDGKKNTDQPGAHCRTDCSLGRCGDGIVDPGEQCDDGNNIDGDGCSARCTLEKNAAGTQVLPANVLQLPFSPSTPGVMLCSSDAQCASGQRCLNGLCSTTHCTSNAQCAAGESCQGGRCVLGVHYGQQSHPPVGKTGPATLAIMAAGGAAGYAFTRRRKSAPPR